MAQPVNAVHWHIGLTDGDKSNCIEMHLLWNLVSVHNCLQNHTLKPVGSILMKEHAVVKTRAWCLFDPE